MFEAVKLDRSWSWPAGATHPGRPEGQNPGGLVACRNEMEHYTRVAGAPNPGGLPRHTLTASACHGPRATGNARRDGCPGTRDGGPYGVYVRRRPTLPRPRGRSTIGAERLNFRVRDGTGCFPFAMAAVTLATHHNRVRVPAVWVEGVWWSNLCDLCVWTRTRVRSAVSPSCDTCVFVCLVE